MSFDGFFARAMTNELSTVLCGGKINKIHQPFKNEIVLNIRANGKNHKLLLSAHPNYARVQLTNEQYENPSEPPMFCMLLRKHLEGFIIENIHQIGLDRIIIFEIKGRNEVGDISKKQLIVEIMGRHSNIVLLDPDRNLILDSIKHVSPAVNSYRSVLPGQEYVLPPAQDKINPLEVNEEKFLRIMDFNSGKLDKQIVEKFAGISPLLAREMIYRAGIANRKTLPRTFVQMIDGFLHHLYQPAITFNETKEYFYLIPLEHVKGEVRPCTSLSALLDRFYFGKADRDRIKQQEHELLRFVTHEKEKNERKIKKLKTTLNEANEKEKYQLYGELLTANMHLVKRGMEEIDVVNYYDPEGNTITIPLDPQKTPSQNAQNYFTKYQKAKNATVMVQEQLAKAKEEIKYFESLLQQIETASTKDIEEIKEELVEEGYIRDRGKRKRNPRTKKPELDRYESSEGVEILVGKNNKQNDYLTSKLASKDDFWFHTKDIPGSHVVVRSKTPTEQTLLEAAQLAAYFSKARNSSSVPVDYTKVRFVRKPNGAKPGFVIYENQQTIYVTPDEEIVLKLRNNHHTRG